MNGPAIIIHGTKSNPASNWFPWLKEELISNDIAALVPAFPTPEGQSLESWKKAFSEQVTELTSDTILIGHSMGVGFILRLLESSTVKVGACLLLSGFLGKIDIEEYDSLNRTYFDTPFNWEIIRKNSGVFKVYHGDDDPYVPIKFGLEIATNLQSELITIQNGGHLNIESGYTKFPRLLEDILFLANKKSLDVS